MKYLPLLLLMTGCLLDESSYHRCLAMHRDTVITIDANGYARRLPLLICDKTEAPPQ